MRLERRDLRPNDNYRNKFPLDLDLRLSRMTAQTSTLDAKINISA